jgi:hypothetical protein
MFFDNFAAKDIHFGTADCTKAEEPPDGRISNITWATISGQNKFKSAKTEEEKWKLLYKTMFPNDRFVPSPC